MPGRSAGSVYCKNCGGRLVLTNAKGRHMYFFCTSRRTGACTQPHRAAHVIEDAVVEFHATVKRKLLQAHWARQP
jgi:hypothetical protein